MTLTPTRTILDDEAIAGAAEAAGLPMILQLSENCIRYHGAFEPIALATLERRSTCQRT